MDLAEDVGLEMESFRVCVEHATVEAGVWEENAQNMVRWEQNMRSWCDFRSILFSLAPSSEVQRPQRFGVAAEQRHHTGRAERSFDEPHQCIEDKVKRV